MSIKSFIFSFFALVSTASFYTSFASDVKPDIETVDVSPPGKSTFSESLGKTSTSTSHLPSVPSVSLEVAQEIIASQKEEIKNAITNKDVSTLRTLAKKYGEELQFKEYIACMNAIEGINNPLAPENK